MFKNIKFYMHKFIKCTQVVNNYERKSVYAPNFPTIRRIEAL